MTKPKGPEEKHCVFALFIQTNTKKNNEDVCWVSCIRKSGNPACPPSQDTLLVSPEQPQCVECLLCGKTAGSDSWEIDNIEAGKTYFGTVPNDTTWWFAQKGYQKKLGFARPQCMCRLWKPLIESQCQSQNGQVLALTLATLLSKEKGAVSPTLTRAKACVVHAVHAIESASVVQVVQSGQQPEVRCILGRPGAAAGRNYWRAFRTTMPDVFCSMACSKQCDITRSFVMGRTRVSNPTQTSKKDSQLMVLPIPMG